MDVLAWTGPLRPNKLSFVDRLRDHFLLALTRRMEFEASTVGRTGAATFVFDRR